MTYDITSNYHGGNPESVAANPGKSDKAQQREDVYKVFAREGSYGATSDEVEVLLGKPHQSVSARITELKKFGRLKITSALRKTRAGRYARVLVCAE